MSFSLAIAGKGGTGKSTIASLIIRHLRERNAGPVLAIDADPDSNLGTLLGMRAGKSVGELREQVLKDIKNFPAGMTKAAYLEAGLHGIIAEAQGFDLITMGRGEGPGCYCYLNSLIRKFSEDLTPSYSWVVLDNEAGLEHISRRTTSNIDVLLVPVTESPLSLDTARNIEAIVGNLKNNIRRKCVITSMVRPEKMPLVIERLAGLGLEHVGDMPRDPAIEDAIIEGTGLLAAPDCPASQSIARIMEKLIPLK
jgi:CO dehydrogenase maturation factor